ncbi:hypothetical protein GGD81_003478 [Rhodobium orientis]|nr:DUF411 domain-containing protein [Rhodobium orientis]MBB4304419.1 hypothetical protein [Rhodobium orientis]MBK5952025.1 hypothetical protein [Rhodobium orientis]
MNAHLTPRLSATTRRSVLGAAVAGVLFALPVASTAAEMPEMHVYKSPTCGCCHLWVDIMKEAGFNVTATDTDDIMAPKEQVGVPDELTSCHTAMVDGYVIEGHVPVPAIRKLLSERPKVRGIAVPGMPYGSPGMGDDPDARYDVVTFGGGSESKVFYSVGK